MAPFSDGKHSIQVFATAHRCTPCVWCTCAQVGAGHLSHWQGRRQHDILRHWEGGVQRSLRIAHAEVSRTDHTRPSIPPLCAWPRCPAIGTFSLWHPLCVARSSAICCSYGRPTCRYESKTTVTTVIHMGRNFCDCCQQSVCGSVPWFRHGDVRGELVELLHRRHDMRPALHTPLCLRRGHRKGLRRRNQHQQHT